MPLTSPVAATSPPDPGREYRRRLSDRQRQVTGLELIDRRFSAARFVVILVALGVAWAVFDPERLATGWLALPVGAFVGLAIAHERVIRRIARGRRAVQYYERGLERIEDRWDGQGFDGLGYLDGEHPYAGDIDLFGPGSVYQLLCAARTAVGRTTLADWLLAPADPVEVRGRQEAIAELAGAIDLREQLAVLGEDVGEDLHGRALVEWAEHPAVFPDPRLRWLPPALVATLLAALIGWAIGVVPRGAVAVAFAAQAGVGVWLRPRVDRIVAAASAGGRELDLIAGVLELIETTRFDSDRLDAAITRLRSDGDLPSVAIRRLDRLLVLLDSRRNQFFAPVALLLMWGTQLSLAVEHWRAAHGSAVARWIDAIGDFEALSSLSAYRYERPDDSFPRISDDPGATFVARGLGHPLLGRSECIRNDVQLDRDNRLLVVSGSNMSGKSTLLRTVGVNAVLALAGAPVRAEGLSLSRLQLGGTLRVQDSLRRGMSGFYSEIHRFRQLVELAGSATPLLFLLEEILNTTNSHDRLVGARAVIGSLLRHGAIGLVTTHDLAITELAVELPTARNVHFVDHLDGDRIRFDYVLRPGVVGKSNAVELMRSIGLDV